MFPEVNKRPLGATGAERYGARQRGRWGEGSGRWAASAAQAQTQRTVKVEAARPLVAGAEVWSRRAIIPARVWMVTNVTNVTPRLKLRDTGKCQHTAVLILVPVTMYN